MSIQGNVTVIATLAAAIILSTAAAAAVSVHPEPGESRGTLAHTTTPSPAPPRSEPISGEHALEYLSRLAREAVLAAQSGTDLPDHPREAHGTNNGTLSAAQRGEPVGAGGTSGGSISPFAVASMR
jgi:hypothetical protein